MALRGGGGGLGGVAMKGGRFDGWWCRSLLDGEAVVEVAEAMVVEVVVAAAMAV